MWSRQESFPHPLYVRRLGFAPALGGRSPTVAGGSRGSGRSAAGAGGGCRRGAGRRGELRGGERDGGEREERGDPADLVQTPAARGSRRAPCLSSAGDAESVNIYP